MLSRRHTVIKHSAHRYSDEHGPLVMLACSARLISQEHWDIINQRKLCQDRKGFFDQFHLNRLTKSTMRIVILQSTQVMTQFLNDQLKEDMARDELVAKGKLTQAEANEEADTWTEKEWQKRWESFPNRLATALAKFHAITIVMRAYEHIAAKYVSEVTLDSLTLDTFDYSKRRAEKHDKSLFFDMLGTCWNANIIAFLADYSVHQAILVFGYYTYVQKQRRDRRQDSSSTDLHGGSVALSFFRKSSLLAVSRGIGLFLSALGGAIGTVLLPGWGTLACINLGDSVAASIADL